MKTLPSALDHVNTSYRVFAGVYLEVHRIGFRRGIRAENWLVTAPTVVCLVQVCAVKFWLTQTDVDLIVNGAEPGSYQHRMAFMVGSECAHHIAADRRDDVCESIFSKHNKVLDAGCAPAGGTS